MKIRKIEFASLMVMTIVMNPLAVYPVSIDDIPISSHLQQSGELVIPDSNSTISYGKLHLLVILVHGEAAPEIKLILSNFYHNS
jgi:hypothetical protein